jgi:hypothetical protein
MQLFKMIRFLSNLSNLVSDPDRQTHDVDLDPAKFYGSDRIRIRNNANCKTFQRNRVQHSFAYQDMRRPALREDEEMDLSSQLRLLLTKLPKLTALHLRGSTG